MPQSGSHMARVFYAAQFFFGGWFLFHGLNWWFRYFPEKSFAPSATGLIPELIRSGLFDIVKVLEVLIGALLLADIFVPLATVAAFPIAFVIGWVNLTKWSLWGVSVCTVDLVVLAIVAVGRLESFLPVLQMNAPAPGMGGLEHLQHRKAPREYHRRLPARRHILAILAGIALPAAITYASIYLAPHGPTPVNDTSTRRPH